VRLRSTQKKYRKNAQDDRKNQKRGESDVRRQGECDLTLQGSPFERNLSDVQTECHVEDRKNTLVRTRRMDIWTNQPYRLDSQNHRPDVPKHTIWALHTKNLKKRGKIAEKYFSSNFQSTHVYNIDISVQLAYQQYPKI
jgi:hypothetical protein